MANCPVCDDQSLQPIQPREGLVARQCRRCEGMLLDLLVYRQWRETSVDTTPVHQLSAAPAAEASAGGRSGKIEDTRHALLCPGCARIMTKYRVTGEIANRFDFCVHCSHVWMDVGELALLNAANLQGDLGRIFTQPWQRQLVTNQEAHMSEENLASHLGQDLSKVEDFADWLVAHTERTRIFAYMSARLRDGGDPGEEGEEQDG